MIMIYMKTKTIILIIDSSFCLKTVKNARHSLPQAQVDDLNWLICIYIVYCIVRQGKQQLFMF